MSTVIKSNQVAVKNFGNIRAISTTAQQEFDKYKARVVADGGVIKDEPYTLAAFNLLFDSKMYGNMNTFVSGRFGVKVSGSSISKLYAIDGIDMIGVKYGTGSLPTLTPDNNISFSANGGVSEAANGGIFTTTNPIVMSKTGSFGMGVRLITNGDMVNFRYLAALSKHSDAVSGTVSTALASKVISGKSAVNFAMQTDPYTINTTTGLVALEQQTAELTTAFLTEPLSNKASALRGGIKTVEKVGKTFTQITSEPFYLDFGGAYISARKHFNNGVVRDFMCYGHATIEQAKKLSDF